MKGRVKSLSPPPSFMDTYDRLFSRLEEEGLLSRREIEELRTRPISREALEEYFSRKYGYEVSKEKEEPRRRPQGRDAVERFSREKPDLGELEKERELKSTRARWWKEEARIVREAFSDYARKREDRDLER